MTLGIPDWRTLKAGSKVRVAVWLHSEIGENGVFRKAQLRDAFPGVEQVDRRMRDLRAEGWVIQTYREDRALEADELRLVKEGGKVWERGYVSQAHAGPTDRERQETFAADDYMCTVCGVSAGEPYPDDRLRLAKLSVSRSASGSPAYETVCDRCLTGGGSRTGVEAMIAQLGGLDAPARQQLLGWLRNGRRTISPEESFWRGLARLSEAERARVMAEFGELGRTE